MTPDPHPLIKNPHLKGGPFFWGAGPTGILLVHGFTATTAEVRPLAQALQRLDSRQQESNQDQVMLLAEHREMLVEVLQSLQPSVQEQIFQPTGQPVSTRYYPSSAS